MKHIRGPQSYGYGYHAITTMDDKEHHSMMDFGILKMKDGDVFTEDLPLERAYRDHIRLKALHPRGVRERKQGRGHNA